MSSNDFHLRFFRDKQIFDIDFQERVKPSADTVMIAGRNFVLQGDESKIAWLKSKILELNSGKNISLPDLESRLWSLGATNVHLSISKTQAAALETLKPIAWKRWSDVSKKFGEFVKRFRDAVPKGCGGWIKVVLPRHLQPFLEDKLGDFAIFVGRSGAEASRSDIDNHTLGNLGSSSKPMTALLAAKMEVEGVLHFSHSVTRYFPKEVLSSFQTTLMDRPINMAEITVGSLTALTAGMPYHQQAGVQQNPKAQEELPLDTLLRDYSDKNSIPFIASPQDNIWFYSNKSLQLTAYVIEKVYKEKLVRDLITNSPKLGTTPLGKFLVEKTDRLDPNLISEKVKNITLNELLNICADPDRKSAYVNGVYIYDLFDMVLAQEAPGKEHLSFEKILKEELLEPLGIHDATFIPNKKQIEEDHVLTYGLDCKILTPDILIFGAGTLFMHADDETRFLQALMQTEVLAESGKVLIPKDTLDAFIEPQSINTQEGYGAIIATDKEKSISLEKSGTIEEYHHFFRCDRMKSAEENDYGFGIFMSNNFLGKDDEWVRLFDELYEELSFILQDVKPKAITRSVPKIEISILSPEEGDVSQAERYFQGGRGYFAYKAGQFLNWSGTPYKIHINEKGQEFILKGDRILEIQLFEGKSGIGYLQIEGQPAAEVPEEKIAEYVLESNPKSRDLSEAKELLEDLVGKYQSRDYPTAFYVEKTLDGYFLVGANEQGGLASAFHPMQVVKVERDSKTKDIVTIRAAAQFREPPDFILQFVNRKGIWILEIVEITTLSKAETCFLVP